MMLPIELMLARHQNSVFGGHKKFWREHKKIFRDKDHKKTSFLLMYPTVPVSSGVGPVVFFWDMIFALGAQKLLLIRILPSHSDFASTFQN